LEETSCNWFHKVWTKLLKILVVVLISVVKIISFGLVNFDDLPFWIDPSAESKLEVFFRVFQQLILHFAKKYILV
jgi:hypothetical protein